MDHVGKLDTPDPDDKRKEEELEEGEVVLPGFRFHPTDEELVGFYLKRKVEKKPLRIELIKHVDIYKYDPWDLPKVSSLLGEKEWYFFCRRGRKYKNSVRPNRVTRSGFWKATGIDKSIYSCCTVKEHHQCIGLKKSLVYYRGSAGKGTKTEWMMHEFRLPPPNANKITNNNNPHDHNATNVDLHEAEVWTLCRIFKRIPSYKKYTPNLKDSAAVLTKLPNVQQVDCKDPLVMPHLIERKPVLIEHVDEKKHFFLGPFGSVAHQAPLSTVSHPSSNLNPDIEEALIGNHENWDDLRSMVQFAINDPSAVYDCSTETYIPPYYF